MALTYSLNAGNTSYKVTSDSCTTGAVVIPSTNNGLPVTIIDSSAFHTCTTITSVSIPNTVTRIGTYAFLNCSNLTEVTIGSGISTIESFVFANCTALTRVIFLGKSPTIETGNFNNTNANLKIYRKKNFVTGWSSTFGGKPVVLLNDNVIKSGGSGKLTTKRRSPYDPDATIYIDNVEAADGQPLEDATKNAINAFVVGCKSDGIWDAIKSSCILAGARTLNGALIPLKGTAPTNFNFISSDYNRATGLQGNASNKYLNSNRACDADPADSIHRAFYITSTSINSSSFIYGALDACSPTDGEGLLFGTDQWFAWFRSLGAALLAAFSANGFIGLSSDNNSTFIYRNNSNQATSSRGVLSPKNNNMIIYAANYRNSCPSSFSGINYSNVRLTFYSLGENLNLSLLNARINTLMSTISTLT
jgi:hypothetical protein